MRKLLILLTLLAIAQGSIQIRPEIAIGKDVNGARALEVIPFRMAWQPVPEWTIKAGASVSYTQARSGVGAFNHYSQGLVTKVEYKPWNRSKAYNRSGCYQVDTKP